MTLQTLIKITKWWLDEFADYDDRHWEGGERREHRENVEEHKLILELAENADKYSWHDLRKDTNDLPTTDEDVLVYHTYYHYKAECVKGETEIGWWNGERWGGDASLGQQNTIIAWMPFPKFKE